jgi:hypothetical protein
MISFGMLGCTACWDVYALFFFLKQGMFTDEVRGSNVPCSPIAMQCTTSFGRLGVWTLRSLLRGSLRQSV